jgi:hypothetical protein
VGRRFESCQAYQPPPLMRNRNQKIISYPTHFSRNQIAISSDGCDAVYEITDGAIDPHGSGTQQDAVALKVEDE